VTSPGPAAGEIPDAVAVVAQAGGENFPVAARVLPARLRRHLLAIYGFARLADDIGDEAPGDRLASLDWLERELEAAAAGAATHPILRALTPTLRELNLPLDPFRRLIEANRQDQRVQRYASWEELAAYCELSANPVGHLVLAVFDAATAERVTFSDRVCTALQLVEHCQDVGEDARRGRVYLPAEDLERFGCREADLLGATASPALRQVLRFELARAAGLLGAGRELTSGLRGWARLTIAGYVAGGQATVDAIAAADHDVLASTPRPSRTRTLARAVPLLVSGRLR
jgi:squalene synthase HpnC